MSDKISERKPDGGLQEWIDFYEMVADGDKDPTELLMLLIELRTHRLRAAEATQDIDSIALTYARRITGDLSDAINQGKPYVQAISIVQCHVIDAIEAAGGTVKG